MRNGSENEAECQTYVGWDLVVISVKRKEERVAIFACIITTKN